MVIWAAKGVDLGDGYRPSKSIFKHHIGRGRCQCNKREAPGPQHHELPFLLLPDVF